MQIHSYYRGNESAVPNIIKKLIVECELIEEYHWTFQEIQKIPIDRLHFLFLWKKMRQAGMSDKEELDKIKRKNQSKISRR